MLSVSYLRTLPKQRLQRLLFSSRKPIVLGFIFIIHFELIFVHGASYGSKFIFNGYPIAPGFPGSSAGKESTCNARDLGLIPGLGKSPGEGIGYPFQY